MERTPSNFNIVKVLEKKKKKNNNSGHQRNHRNSIFNVRTQKNPYSPLQRYRSLQKKKRKEKQKTSMTVEKSKRFQSMVQRKGLRRPSSKKFHYAPRA